MVNLPQHKQAIDTEALVLRSYPSGDYDMVYRLLSPEYGKLSAFARSVRKSKKRFNSLPETFDIGIATLSAGRGELMNFNGFIPHKNFHNFRESFISFTTACTVCECFDALTVEHSSDRSEELFRTAIDCLTTLSQETESLYLPADRAIRKLLRISGFIEDGSRQEDHTPPEQWEHLLDRVEQIIEKPLKSRL